MVQNGTRAIMLRQLTSSQNSTYISHFFSSVQQNSNVVRLISPSIWCIPISALYLFSRNLSITRPFGWSSNIWLSYPCWKLIPSTSFLNMTQSHLMVYLQSWHFVELLIILGQLWPVRVPSMGQIELFNRLIYLRTFNCVPKNLLVLDGNTWNHLSMCRQLNSCVV